MLFVIENKIWFWMCWWHFSTELMYSIFPVCVCICLFCVEFSSWTGWTLQISWTGWHKQIHCFSTDHSHVISMIRIIHISITVLIHYETSSYVINKTRVTNLSDLIDIWLLFIRVLLYVFYLIVFKNFIFSCGLWFSSNSIASSLWIMFI